MQGAKRRRENIGKKEGIEEKGHRRKGIEERASNTMFKK